MVLSRKIGETIVIGDNIRVTIVEVRGGKVRIGIAAPADVIVDRQEIHDQRLNMAGEWAGPAIYQPVS